VDIQACSAHPGCDIIFSQTRTIALNLDRAFHLIEGDFSHPEYFTESFCFEQVCAFA
jgi:hypothetical protein